jgi:hypothetical protein
MINIRSCKEIGFDTDQTVMTAKQAELFLYHKTNRRLVGPIRLLIQRHVKHTIPYLFTGLFISPSGIFDPCGTVAGMVTPKERMSTEGETLQVSVLPYRCSCNQVPATRVVTRVAGT